MQFRQKIILMTLLLFSLLLTTVYALQFNHTRAYLAKQMAVDVTNTVNFLGLALLPHLEQGEYVAAETTINAVFDGGSYQQIRLRLVKDGRELLRQQQGSLSGVPDWFVELDLFAPIKQSNMLTSGWLQHAELQVVADTAYAYEQLWRLSTQLLLWFSGAAVVVMGLLLYAMRRLFGPLIAIEARANEIAEQKFGKPLPDPELRELKGLVVSFNAMSARLQKQFHRQAEEAENLRQTAYQDRLTQLANKHFFDVALEQWMAEPGEGGVLFIRLYQLQSLANEAGFERRDQRLLEVAEYLKALQLGHPKSTVARSSLDEFSLILPGYDPDQVGALIVDLDRQLTTMNAKQGGRYAIGGAIRGAEMSIGELLSRTDSALQEVSLDSTCAYKLQNTDRLQPALGRSHWRELVLASLSTQGLNFQLQPVKRIDGSLKALELFSVIVNQQYRYPAAQFMPFVEQFLLGAQFDRHVIERVVPWLAGQSAPIMINLSESAIGDAAFICWLEQLLDGSVKLKKQLIFELPETALRSQSGGLETLCAMFRRQRVGFGFDRISHHLGQLEGLAELEPNYLKVDRSLLFSDQDENNVFALALARLAHDVDIELLVLRIEDPQQLQQLAQKSIDGYQGYIDKPRDWILQ